MEKSLFKVSPGYIKVRFENIMLAMSSLHIFSLVVMRTSSYKSNKLFLSASLFAHISCGKEMSDLIISKHKIVELIDHSTDSGFSP